MKRLEKAINDLAKSEHDKISKAKEILGDDYVIVTLENWNYEVEEYKRLVSLNERYKEALEDIAFGRVEGDYSDMRYRAREALEE